MVLTCQDRLPILQLFLHKAYFKSCILIMFMVTQARCDFKENAAVVCGAT